MKHKLIFVTSKMEDMKYELIGDKNGKRTKNREICKKDGGERREREGREKEIKRKREKDRKI